MADVYSNWSQLNLTTFPVPTGTIEPPSDFFDSVLGASEVFLQWAQVGDAELYYLERTDEVDGQGDPVWTSPVQVWNGLDTKYRDTGLDPETLYFYRIRSFKTV